MAPARFLIATSLCVFATLAATPSAIAQGDEPSWIHVDLAPAVDHELITTTVRDEGEQVTAEAGRFFVTIPFRYDPAIAPRTLTRTAMKARELRGLWGIRLLPEPVGPVHLALLEEDPLYERWELRAATGRPQVTVRNTTPPRLGGVDQPGAGGRADRRSPRSMTIPASGCAAVIVETSNETTRLSWTWGDGGEATIDLNAIRKAREPLPLAPTRDAASPDRSRAKPDSDAVPMLRDVLNAVTGKSPPNAALAVHRLSRARRAWPSNTDPSFLAELDTLILEAGASQHPSVRAAAWSYFAEPFEAFTASAWISPAAADRLARDEALAGIWLENAQRGLGRRDGGLFWTGLVGDESSRRSLALFIATDVSRGTNHAAVADACELLLELAPWPVSTDAGQTGSGATGGHGDGASNSDGQEALRPDAPVDLTRFSPVALEELIDRLPKLKDGKWAGDLLRRLTILSPPRLADALSREFQRRKIAIGGPQDALLSGWEALRSNEQRLALLTVLERLPIGDVFYSPEFARLLHDATGPLASKDVRAAARRLIMRIASSDLSPAEPNPFPVLVLLSARDPLVDALMGVCDTDATDDVDVRLAVAEQLLRRGLAEHAAKIVAQAPSGKQRLALVDSLLAMKPPPTDALAALAGFLLRKETADCIRPALNYLARRAASEPSGQRWRLLAAVRAGVHLGELDVLSLELKGANAVAARRWVHELGHMSAQDRQRLAGATTPEDRIERLKETDFRRGTTVEGVYGALAIIETVSAQVAEPTDEHSGGSIAWSLPTRWTVSLPEITLETPPDVHEKPDAPYKVLFGKTAIGEGRVSLRPAVLGSPATFSIALTSSPWDRWGRPVGPKRGEAAAGEEGEGEVGPLLLSTRKVLEAPRAGTMTLDLAPLLKRALSQDKALARRIATTQIPQKAPITLRYAAFGSFYGAAELTCELPDAPPAGFVYPRAVMVVLERVD